MGVPVQLARSARSHVTARCLFRLALVVSQSQSISNILWLHYWSGTSHLNDLTNRYPVSYWQTSARRGYLSGIVAWQYNDSIRAKGLLLPSPSLRERLGGEGLGMRAIELRLASNLRQFDEATEAE